MPSVTLKAQYGGERTQLDEPFDLARDALLLVTVLPPEENRDPQGRGGAKGRRRADGG